MSYNNQKQQDLDALGDPLQILNNFYREIVLIKQSIEHGDLDHDVAQFLGLSRLPTNEEITETISARLQRWIEKKRNAARKVLTDKEYSRINETLFVAAALADELFILEIEWVGQAHWHSVLLEERVFHSCYAGERFYTGVVKLLNERVLDSQQRNLMAVYFLAMRLGFAGRYRDQPKRLQYVRQQLYKRINGGISDGDEFVSPQAYEHLLSSVQERRLAPLARWKKLSAQIFLFYIISGWALWTVLKGHWVIGA